MENILQNEIVFYVLSTVLYVISAFVLFFIGKVSYQIFHPNINVKDELVEKDNLAFAVAHTGYFIGILLAIGSAIIGESKGLTIDLLDIGTYGLLAILLLNISTLLTDKVLLSRFNVRKEIVDDQNVGTGVVEAANAIASGLILLGAITGESGVNLGVPVYLNGYISAVLFWIVGQIAILLIGYMYNLITPYDIYEHIEKDNVAVGIGFAGAIIAIGNLIRFALAGNFVSWSETFGDIGSEIAIGLILLPIGRILADKILLPGRKLTDEIVNQEKPNVGAAIIEAFAYIGSSVIITWCL